MKTVSLFQRRAVDFHARSISISSGKYIVHPCQPNDSFSCLRGVRRYYTKVTARSVQLLRSWFHYLFEVAKKNRRNRRSCKAWRPLRRFLSMILKKRPGKQPRRKPRLFLENPKTRSIFAPFDSNGNTSFWDFPELASISSTCKFFFAFNDLGNPEPRPPLVSLPLYRFSLYKNTNNFLIIKHLRDFLA